MEKIGEILQSAREEGRLLEVVMFDIDYFKRINDLHGHAVGDQVLKEFANFLRSSLRAGDLLIRYGGDEFIVILDNVGYSEGLKVVERILENCKKQEFAGLKITASAGIASFPKHADCWEELFKLVDKSLYFAKRNGRDRVGILQNVGRVIIPTYDIVGRIDEIEKIIDFIEDNASHAKVIHVIGEIGVGKTRLIKEVLDYPKLKSYDKFQNVLSTSTKSIVFYPIRQLIKYMSQQNGKFLKELPPVLLSEIYKLNPPERSELGELFYVDKFKLFEAVRELLRLYTEKVLPLIVFIDDAHYIDDYSLELFSYVFRSEDIKGLVVIFASRVEETGEDRIKKFFNFLRRGLMELRLMPLGKDGIRHLCKMVFGQVVPDFFIDFLFSKSGGNPYIAYEVIEAMLNSGDVYWNGESWEFKKDFEFDVPPSLIALAEMKVANLQAKELVVLEYMAVYGKPIDLDLLTDLTGLRFDELIPVIESLENIGLITREFTGSYYIPEGVFIECLCKKLSDKRLALIHYRIADLMRRVAPDAVEEIALHYYKAGDFENGFEFLLKAAERAEEFYAIKEAITYYSWALGCLQRYQRIGDYEKKKAEILLRRSKLYLEIGDRKAALVDAEEALNIALNVANVEIEAEANKQMGAVFLSLARYNEAIERLERASNQFEKLRNFIGVMECDLHIGLVFKEQSKYKLSRSYFLRVLEMAKSMNTEYLEMRALYHLSSLLSDCGKLDEALPLLQDALEMSTKLKDRKLEMKIYNELGLLHVEKGEIEKGIEILHKCLELAQKLFDLRTEAAVCHNIGLVLFVHLGKTLEAIEYLEKSSRVFHLIDDRFSECIVLSSLGTIYKSMGNYRFAKEYFTKSLKIAREIKAERLILSGSLNLANLLLDYGKIRSALPKLQTALRLSRKLELKDFESKVFLSIGAYYYYVGDLKEAERYFQSCIKLAEENNYLYNLASAELSLLRVYLDVGDLRKASDLHEKVEKVVRKLKNDVIQIDYEILSLELDFLQGKLVSLKKVNMIIEKCKALGLQPRLADAMVLAGRVTARMEAVEKSREYFEKAITILKKVGNTFYLARAYALYAEILKYSGYKEEALLNYNRAYEIFGKHKSDVWMRIFSIPQYK